MSRPAQTSHGLRILVAEDSDDDFLLIQRELARAGFEVKATRVQTPDTMRDALERSDWDAVLSDFSMPAFDGMKALELLLASRQPHVPFIIVSGSIGEIRAVSALKAGAANYVMKENLEKLVPVLQRELRDAQMRGERVEALAALKQSVKARDEFMSIASHELKTPLTALFLQVQSLLRVARGPGGAKLSNEQVLSRLESVSRSASRLTELIDRMLDITRVTVGRLQLTREELDLTAVTEEAIGRLDEVFRDARCPVKLEASGHIAGFWDRDRLETVIVNLLTNAAKYGPGAPIKVALEDGGTEARVRVTDSGIGISEEDQRRIFERFERAVPERHYGGFGVGLWLSRQIAEAHGGRIAVESAPGKGSIFTVILPKRGEGGGARE